MRSKFKFLASDFDYLERREVLSHVVHVPVHHPAHHAVHAAKVQVHTVPKALHPTAARVVIGAATPHPTAVARVTIGAATPHPTISATAVHPAVVTAAPQAAVTTPTPVANLDSNLNAIYAAFESGSDSASIAAQFPNIQFSGSLVGVSIRARSDVNALSSELTNLGGTIVASSSAYLTVQAFVPINELPTIAALDQTVSGIAMYKPSQGAAPHGSAMPM